MVPGKKLFLSITSSGNILYTSFELIILSYDNGKLPFAINAPLKSVIQ